MKTFKKDDLVIVATEGGKPGTVAYVSEDNIGVALLNERGRVDEWMPSQVEHATPKQASDAALKFKR